MTYIRKFFILLVAALLSAGGLLGCEREGPLERAGENVDRTIERGEDRVAPLDREGPAERAGERMDRPVERD